MAQVLAPVVDLHAQPVDGAHIPQHSPHTLVIKCMDSRMPSGFVFRHGPNEIIEHNTAGGGIPPFKEADDQWLSKYGLGIFHFGIRNIVCLTHNSCGGAGVAHAMLRGLPPSSGNPLEPAARRYITSLGLPVVSSMQRGEQFACAALSAPITGPDDISRMFGEQNYQNLMGYPTQEGTMADSIARHAIDLVVLFKDLATHTFEAYEPEKKIWVPVDRMHQHFCAKAQCGVNGQHLGCAGCDKTHVASTMGAVIQGAAQGTGGGAGIVRYPR